MRHPTQLRRQQDQGPASRTVKPAFPSASRPTRLYPPPQRSSSSQGRRECGRPLLGSSRRHVRRAASPRAGWLHRHTRFASDRCSSQALLHTSSHLFACGVEAEVRRLKWTRQSIRHLPHRELLDFVEDEDVALLGRELLQNSKEHFAQVAELELTLLVGRCDRLRRIVARVFTSSANRATAIARDPHADLPYPRTQ